MLGKFSGEPYLDLLHPLAFGVFTDLAVLRGPRCPGIAVTFRAVFDVTQVLGTRYGHLEAFVLLVRTGSYACNSAVLIPLGSPLVLVPVHAVRNSRLLIHLIPGNEPDLDLFESLFLALGSCRRTVADPALIALVRLHVSAVLNAVMLGELARQSDPDSFDPVLLAAF